VQADEESNALVINAPASIFPSLRAVIQQLDIPRAQVHIEAIIAEVSLNTSKELGVQWLLHDNNTAAGSVQFSTFGTTIGGIAEGIGDGLLSTILPDGGALGLGTISDNGLSVAVLIRALQGDGETNLLSTPSLVTLDNQEAEIIVGQNVPFVTGQSTGSSSSTENPFQTIERQDIGIQLKVTPQINEGDAITMDISQEVSDIAASSEGAVDIVTTKRAITTTVQLDDGELLVLGGLISDRLINVEQKVPFLGDLPLIGALFRASSVEKGKQNLMVFIRATIIKDPEKARRLSLKKYNFLRDLQLQYSGEDQLGPALVPYDELGTSLYEFETPPASDE
jgi:general secretion pathway protein D